MKLLILEGSSVVQGVHLKEYGVVGTFKLIFHPKGDDMPSNNQQHNTGPIGLMRPNDKFTPILPQLSIIHNLPSTLITYLHEEQLIQHMEKQ